MLTNKPPKSPWKSPAIIAVRNLRRFSKRISDRLDYYKQNGVRVGAVTFLRPAFIITGCNATGLKGSKYLTRFRLIDAEAFGKYLHIFHRSDSDAYHSHPWSFSTFILWRGYVEEVPAIYPNWQSDPAAASEFNAIVRKTPRFVALDNDFGPLHNPIGDFFGHWQVQSPHYPARYPDYCTVYHNGKYWKRRFSHTSPMLGTDKPPDQSPEEWLPFDPETPRRLHLRPFTLHKRPASYVHRVRLFTVDGTRNGRSLPAVTFVSRSSKAAQWGFWNRGRFQDWETYFKENDC